MTSGGSNAALNIICLKECQKPRIAQVTRWHHHGGSCFEMIWQHADLLSCNQCDRYELIWQHAVLLSRNQCNTG